MDTELAQLVRARVAHCNDGDWAAVRALTGAGYAYREAGTGGRIDDIDDVLAALGRLRAADPETHIDVGPVLTEGDVSVADLIWNATLTQRRLRVADRVWTRWADGKLIAEWHEVGVLALVAPLVDAALTDQRAGSAAPARRWRYVELATCALPCAPARLLRAGRGAGAAGVAMGEPGGTDRIETDLEVVAGVTDRGHVHERNEDAMAIGRWPDGTVAAVVCDGVSTSLTPQQASRIAADAALDVLLTSSAPAPERVDTAALAAASAVATLGRAGDPHAPSCTLVCALARPGEITIGWVGDSRAYWLAPPDAAEPARQVTVDHSWAAQMVAAGVLDDAAAMRDPRAHAITRWLGAGGTTQVEITTLHPAGPGALLLCTDGLWNYRPDAADLAAVTLPELADGGAIAAAKALTALALDAGGRDNITVVVIPA